MPKKKMPKSMPKGPHMMPGMHKKMMAAPKKKVKK